MTTQSVLQMIDSKKRAFYPSFKLGCFFSVCTLVGKSVLPKNCFGLSDFIQRWTCFDSSNDSEVLDFSWSPIEESNREALAVAASIGIFLGIMTEISSSTLYNNPLRTLVDLTPAMGVAYQAFFNTPSLNSVYEVTSGILFVGGLTAVTVKVSGCLRHRTEVIARKGADAAHKNIKTCSVKPGAFAENPCKCKECEEYGECEELFDF